MHDFEVTPRVLKAAAQNSKEITQILGNHLRNIVISEEVLQAAARNENDQVVRLIFEYTQDTHVIKKLVNAALGNKNLAYQIMYTLLIQADQPEDILKAAVANRKQGKEVPWQLIAHQKDLHISLSVVQQTVKNSGCGQEVLEQLKREWKIPITRDIARAAMINRISGHIMMKALLSQDREMQITEDAINIIKSKLNVEVNRLLQDRNKQIQIVQSLSLK